MIEPGVRGSVEESVIVGNTTGLLNILIWIIVILCAFWITYEIAKKHRHWHAGKKLLWIFCAIIFNVLAVIAYYFIEYKKK